MPATDDRLATTCSVPLAVAVSPQRASDASRWPLSAEHAEFTSLPGGSSHAGVGRDLFGRLARMGLHTMALTLVLFFAVPRFGQVAWRGPIAASRNRWSASPTRSRSANSARSSRAARR